MTLVSAGRSRSSAAFNLQSVNVQSPGRLNASIGLSTMQFYLVCYGDIEFHIKLQVGGLSRSEVLEMLQQKINIR
jgi:hypothetical protein